MNQKHIFDIPNVCGRNFSMSYSSFIHCLYKEEMHFIYFLYWQFHIMLICQCVLEWSLYKEWCNSLEGEIQRLQFLIQEAPCGGNSFQLVEISIKYYWTAYSPYSSSRCLSRMVSVDVLFQIIIFSHICTLKSL